AAGAGRRGDRDRSGGRDAPLLLDLVLQLDQLEDGHAPELLEHRVDGCHLYASWVSSVSVVSASSAGASASGSGVGSCSASAAGCSGSAGAASVVSPPSCSMRASISPYRFCNGALTSP